MADQERNTVGHSFAEILVDESADALKAVAPDGRVLFWNADAVATFRSSEA